MSQDVSRSPGFWGTAEKRRRTAVGLLVGTVCFGIAVATRVGHAVPGHSAYRLLLGGAVVAVPVLAILVAANRDGTPRSPGTGWRVVLLLLFIFAFPLALYVGVAGIAAAAVTATGKGSVWLLLAAAVAVFGVLFVGGLAGATSVMWNRHHREAARLGGQSVPAPR